jgi:polyhydroxyalkanoate synthesis regulator phasin
MRFTDAAESIPARKDSRMRKTLAAAATALLLVAGFAAGAALGSPGVAAADTADDVATEAQVGPIEDVLAGLVTGGVITQDQAQAVADALHARFGAQPGWHGHRAGGNIQVAADTIGIDAADLLTALRDGQTVAEVAADHGVAVADVVDAIVADANDHIDQAVENGRITSDRADELKTELATRVEAFVNGDTPLHDTFQGRRGGHGFRPFGTGNAGDPAPELSGLGV